MSYGTVDEVAAYVGSHLNSAGTFDGETQPTYTQVATFLTRRSAILDGILAASGIHTPLTATRALSAISYYAIVGAAADVELAQAAGGWNDEDGNRRENKFLAEFRRMKADLIDTGMLVALGAVQDSSASPTQGVYVGGSTRGPIFTRGLMGNDTSAERGTRERDGTW